MQNRFECFTKNITAIYRAIQKIKHMEMTEFGLKGMHVMCLFFLSKHPEGLTAAQLCEKCVEDKAAISRSIATLKEKRFVYESQTDEKKKYRSIIRLTETGQAVASKEAYKIANAVSIGGDGLHDSDRAIFYKSLELISKNLEKYTTCLRGEQ